MKLQKIRAEPYIAGFRANIDPGEVEGRCLFSES